MWVQKDIVVASLLRWIIIQHCLNFSSIFYLNYIPKFWFDIYSAVCVYVYLIIFSIAIVSILNKHPSRKCFVFALFSQFFHPQVIYWVWLILVLLHMIFHQFSILDGLIVLRLNIYIHIYTYIYIYIYIYICKCSSQMN